MNRRRFLQFLGLGAASTITAAAVQATGLDIPADFDVEKALWTPGAKSIFIPEPAKVEIPEFVVDAPEYWFNAQAVRRGRPTIPVGQHRYTFTNNQGVQYLDPNGRVLRIFDNAGRDITRQDLHDAQALLLVGGTGDRTKEQYEALERRNAMDAARRRRNTPVIGMARYPRTKEQRLEAIAKEREDRTKWGVTLE